MTKPRIKTQAGRVLTGSCSKSQASAFLTRRKVALNDMLRRMTPKQQARYYAMDVTQRHLYETKQGVPARDGNCTFQSAEYVLRFGSSFFERQRPAAQPSAPKPSKPSPKPASKPSETFDSAPWWKTFGFDSEADARG